MRTVNPDAVVVRTASPVTLDDGPSLAGRRVVVHGLDEDTALDYCKGCGICAAECTCGAIRMVPEQTRRSVSG